jgi:hypothetical protein
VGQDVAARAAREEIEIMRRARLVAMRNAGALQEVGDEGKIVLTAAGARGEPRKTSPESAVADDSYIDQQRAAQH